MSRPLVSVVIPTLNPGGDLAPLLEGVFQQELDGQMEVWVVDSGTRPGGLAPLGRWPVRRVDIDPRDFGHGKTRNMMVKRVQGEFVAFFTQDCLPADAHVLAELVAALRSLPRADGAYARQIPRPDADEVVIRRLGEVFPGGEMSFQQVAPGEWQTLTPLERLHRARYDHVACLSRREALLQRPLLDLPFGEDLAWGIDTVLAGRGLVYVPSARVIHSHKRSPVETFRRTRLEHQQLAQLVGLHLVPDGPTLMRGFAALSGQALYKTGRDPGRLPHHLGEYGRLLAELLGQWQGGRV